MRLKLENQTLFSAKMNRFMRRYGLEASRIPDWTPQSTEHLTIWTAAWWDIGFYENDPTNTVCIKLMSYNDDGSKYACDVDIPITDMASSAAVARRIYEATDGHFDLTAGIEGQSWDDMWNCNVLEELLFNLPERLRDMVLVEMCSRA